MKQKEKQDGRSRDWKGRKSNAVTVVPHSLILELGQMKLFAETVDIYQRRRND